MKDIFEQLMTEPRVVVYDVDGEALAVVGYLANQKLLGTSLDGKDLVRKINEYLPDKLRIDFNIKRDIVYPNCNILTVSAANSALDDLGVGDIRTATPEEVMAVLREDLAYNDTVINPFAVILYDANEGHTHSRHLYNQLRDAGVIASQYELPVVIASLRVHKDDNFSYGVRLDYVPDRSVVIKAPALIGDSFATNREQSIEDVFSKGRESTGDLSISIIRNRGLVTLYSANKNLATYLLIGERHSNGSILLSRNFYYI